MGADHPAKHAAGSNMTVAELIAFLQTQPQDIQVAYECHSEHCLLDAEEIQIEELCAARPDGWIHDFRPDRPKYPYLVLPGN